MIDLFDLERFLTAQGPVYDAAVQELRSGRKRTHWMWFIFPQLRGLGHSFRAQFYGLVSLDEARAYLHHPILGERLEACTTAVLNHPDISLLALLGSPDDVKFHSSMSIFALASEAYDNVFQRALNQRFDGQSDDRTLALIPADSVDFDMGESRAIGQRSRAL